ncbi:negative regulator of beta-lactamase expression [Burkholderiales bacterium JOSHI_001]|nr:negative regulator of beta-lactamase expression [Burkholderiales bacterium JOSHI_001]
MPIQHRPLKPVPRKMPSAESVNHPVKDGESWESLAKRYGVPAHDIVMYNFGTVVPAEVNWYLYHHVGCRKPTQDGKNWKFSSGLNPGTVQIPPQNCTFDELEVVAAPMTYAIKCSPSAWAGPGKAADPDGEAQEVVSAVPWRHGTFTLGALSIKGRRAWGANEPVWANEVVYYNTAHYPLDRTYDRIVVHHTDNHKTIKGNEESQIGRGYAALGYHFFIESDGAIFEGRPLEVMGSHAGEGLTPGPLNDPDFGAIGIVLRGNYDGLLGSSAPPPAQFDALRALVIELRKQLPGMRRLQMHKEVVRKGDPTQCPGDHLVPKVDALRKDLGL